MFEYYDESEGIRNTGPSARQIREDKYFEDLISNELIDLNLYEKCQNPGELILININKKFKILHQDNYQVEVCNISEGFKILSNTNETREDLILEFPNLTIIRLRFISPEGDYKHSNTILIQKSVEWSIVRLFLEYQIENESKREFFISTNDLEQRVKDLNLNSSKYSDGWELSDIEKLEYISPLRYFKWNRKYDFLSDTLWMYFSMLNEDRLGFKQLIEWIDHFDILFNNTSSDMLDFKIIQSLNTIKFYVYEELNNLALEKDEIYEE